MGFVTFRAVRATAAHPSVAAVDLAAVADPVCRPTDPGMASLSFIRGHPCAGATACVKRAFRWEGRGGPGRIPMQVASYLISRVARGAAGHRRRGDMDKETPMSFEYPRIPDYRGREGTGTQAVDWEERINMERLRAYRLRRTKDEMVRRQVGALLLLNEWNIRYATSTWTAYWTAHSSGLRYALLPASLDAPILYEQGEIGYHTRQIAPWVAKVKVAIGGAGWIGRTMGVEAHAMQRNKMVQQIADDVRDAGMGKELLAVDTWDLGLVEGLQREGLRVSPIGSDVMLEARKIKNPDEVECLRICTSIGDAIFGEVARAIRPGVKESELAGLAHHVAYKLGARVYSGIGSVASGAFAWPNPRDESDRMIRPRDLVYMDVYNVDYLGYKICYYRTFSCGKASQQAKDDYRRALDWLYGAMQIVRPGVTTREVAEKWPPGPQIWGDILVRHEDQTAGSNWGHGIGLTLYEPPIIWRAVSLEHPMVIEEGMTFALETQHGTPGSHGVRIEEMLHVTKSGVEILSKWPIDEITEVPLV